MIHELHRPTRRCHQTGRDLKPGERYFSALVETHFGLERRDFSVEAWTGPPEGTVGHWAGKLPETTSTTHTSREMSTEELIQAFDRLETESFVDPQVGTRLRYVLALLLLRRRALKLHSIQREGGRETLLVRRPPSPAVIEIADPNLTEAQTRDVETQLADWLATSSDQGAGVIDSADERSDVKSPCV